MRGQWTRRKVVKAYRRLRPPPPPPDPRHKAFYSACYAPSTSMYFDQFGNVRACCQNTGHLMGTVREQSIREIWDSAAAGALRDALVEEDYSLGCGFCQWQVDQGDTATVFARIFDLNPALEPHPQWPVQMEFSMTNSCNLQCVMCNGDWSSSIRANREQRPPLPTVYDDGFFEELAEFLPHLRKVNILGGEPFLGREPLRLLDMLAELPDPPEVAVTTNGTQWSPRIERICDRLPISFVVSLDGITKETYESIRVGADFDEVMGNLLRFQEYAARNDTMVSLAHCLMTTNWWEFAHLLRFAEVRGLEVGMNEVLFPAELSLFQLPADELRDIVESMESSPDGAVAHLSRLRPLWDGQISALRHRLEALDTGTAVRVRPWANRSERAEPWIDLATSVLLEWGDTGPVRLDVRHDHPEVDELRGESPLTPSSTLRSLRSPADVVDLLAASLGPDTPRSIGTSDLLHDHIVGETGTHQRQQFRIVWNPTTAGATVLIAERHSPDRSLLTTLLAQSPAEEVSSRQAPSSVGRSML